MAKNTRLSPNKYAKEKAQFAALKKITDYEPRKEEYAVAAIEPVINGIDSKLEREAQILAELAALRDEIAADCTILVEKNDGAALQVAAQYGDDSTEWQSLGRTRKSERATGLTRKPKNTGNTPNS